MFMSAIVSRYIFASTLTSYVLTVLLKAFLHEMTLFPLKQNHAGHSTLKDGSKKHDAKFGGRTTPNLLTPVNSGSIVGPFLKKESGLTA